MREVVLVTRTKSRHGLDYGKRVAEELPKRGIQIAESHTVRTRKELKSAVRRAVKECASTVVVVGGDGTQTAVVGELAHSQTALAVIPAGTGNSFALSLGIPDLDAAIQTIADGRIISADVGEVNGTRFANFATIGFLAEAAKETPSLVKRFFGALAYVFSGLRNIDSKPFLMKIKHDGKAVEILTQQAIVANGPYFGFQKIDEEADLRSGKLFFFTVPSHTPLDILTVNAALLAGLQEKLPDAHFFPAEEIAIKTKPRQAIVVDGHYQGKTPAKFRCFPKALRVMVPLSFPQRASK